MPALLRRLTLAGLLAGLAGCSMLPVELPGRQPDAGGITERPASGAKARLKPMPLRKQHLPRQRRRCPPACRKSRQARRHTTTRPRR